MSESEQLRVGLIGYGKTGRAVASVLLNAPELALQWIARREQRCEQFCENAKCVPVVGLRPEDWATWLDDHPVDAIVDFSTGEAVMTYGSEVAARRLMLVSAVSAYSAEQRAFLQHMGTSTRVMSSPNITLGINFLLAAARLLRGIAPFADVEIIEQHFKGKPEVSGTARVIAESLQLEDDKITSLRVGGIIGHHEVIFGFPHQTVRLAHDSIRREAFGTGAVFALLELARNPVGFYTFDDLLRRRVQAQWLADTQAL